MAVAPVTCPICKAPWPWNLVNSHESRPCPGCGHPLVVEVFPAQFRQIAPGQTGEALLEDSDSSCFYHPTKKAILPCEGCGRFLCALCDCELDGLHFCPACLDAGKRKGKIKSLERQRTMYDSMALVLAMVPNCVTPVIALYVAIRHWRSPTSVVRRTKIRFVLAIILAGIQLLGWTLLIGRLVARNSR
jgi:hypothetical protein